jgi:exonuclease SbcD
MQLITLAVRERENMNQIKILHCADLHLGAELSSIGTHAKQRREEILITFYRIVTICKEEGIALLLIAGDFFEGFDIDKNTVKSVKEVLAGIPNTIVAIAPGNHDYVSIDSPYSDTDWPEHVHIFRSGLECVTFEEKGLRLWGAGFTSTYVTEPLLHQTDIPDDGKINICVLHGDLVAENQSSNYNPISPTQIRFSGMDYLALGHIHKRTDILQSGTTHYAYCGCPEGKGFDELDEKGVYIGIVSKGRADLDFRPVCRRMNLEVPVDISGAATNNEVSETIIHTIKEKYGEEYSKHLYKVILEGALHTGFTPDCVAIALRLENDLYFIKIKDQTHIAIDFNELAKETSLKGIFVRKMLDKLNNSLERHQEQEAYQYRRALHIGLKAFDSEVTLNEN